MSNSSLKDEARIQRAFRALDDNFFKNLLQPATLYEVPHKCLRALC